MTNQGNIKVLGYNVNINQILSISKQSIASILVNNIAALSYQKLVLVIKNVNHQGC